MVISFWRNIIKPHFRRQLQSYYNSLLNQCSCSLNKTDIIQENGGFSRLAVGRNNQLSAVPFVNGFGGISSLKKGKTADFLFVLSINDECICGIIPPTNWLISCFLYRSFFSCNLCCKPLVLYSPYIATIVDLHILT